MESLFKLTDLETRVPLNLNVLDADGRPGVMTLRDALNAWLAHRRVVLVRRSSFRLGKIEARLEVLEGYLVVFLNLDEVIAIIREADNPRAGLIERFSLTDAQATAILDMRLRSLRRLEEMALKAERDSLISEREELTALVGDEVSVAADHSEIREMKAAFVKTRFPPHRLCRGAGDRPRGRRNPGRARTDHRHLFGKGWIRAMKGHQDLESEFKYKEGDGPAFILHAETTDRILLFAENGRFYTLAADKLPKGRGLVNR